MPISTTSISLRRNRQQASIPLNKRYTVFIVAKKRVHLTKRMHRCVFRNNLQYPSTVTIKWIELFTFKSISSTMNCEIFNILQRIGFFFLNYDVTICKSNRT